MDQRDTKVVRPTEIKVSRLTKIKSKWKLKGPQNRN